MDIQFVSRKVVMDSILDKMNRKETLTQDEKDFLRSMSEKQEGK